jgi:EmrB/QacA subfamily drug resistance transporter
MAAEESLTQTLGGGRGRALMVVCGVLFLTFLDTTIVSVALADIQTTLHAGVQSLQWVVNGYALVFAGLMLGMGTVGDRFGRKRVMLAGVAVFTLGSLLGALAPTVELVIASRVIMGVGAAACEPGTLSIIRHLYPEFGPRARALGAWAAISGLALALGPVIGGVMVGLGGWRYVFWFNVAAGAAALIAAHLAVPESADPQNAKFDVAGFVLGPLAVGAAIFAVILGETEGYFSPGIMALFALSAVLIAAFVVVERRSPAPTLDVDYFRKPGFSGAMVVAFAAYFGIFSIFFFTALYLQIVTGYSGYRVATLFMPMAAAMIFSSVLAGRWVARAGPRVPMTIGCVAAGAGILLTELALVGQPGFLGLALSLTLAGLGFGVAVVPVTSVALTEVPAAHSGMAASATSTSREMGSVVGVAVLGAIVNGHLAVDLAARLTTLGVPPMFQKIVIDAVETGKVPSGGSGGAAKAAAAFGPLVVKVIDAAYGAFHTGLNVSLTVSGVTILASALVAWFAVGRSRSSVAEPFDDTGGDADGAETAGA